MRRKRQAVPLRVKLAAALLALGHIDYEESKRMSAAQIISRYDFDHWPILHALGGPDLPWNLRPLLKAAHREKSGKDTSAVAKVKRIRKKYGLDKSWDAAAAHYAALEEMARHAPGKPAHAVSRPKRRIAAPARPWPPRGSRKLRSRPWPSPSP